MNTDSSSHELAFEASAINREDITSEMMTTVTKQSSHCLIYARKNELDKKPIILMQLRGDGYIGFPGGFIEPGETPEHAVNREIEEEMASDEEIHIDSSHYIISHFSESSGFLSHFFAMEISLQNFRKIEQKALLGPQYGEEVCGILRIPLNVIGKEYSDFSVFIKHQFVGRSKLQLLCTIEKLGFLTCEEIQRVLNAKKFIVH